MKAIPTAGSLVVRRKAKEGNSYWLDMRMAVKSDLVIETSDAYEG